MLACYGVLAVAAGRPVPVHAASYAASVRDAGPAPAGRADAADVYLDEPPPSSYDRLGERHPLALAPESLGLMAQLGRTLLGLAGTLALLFLFCKLLLPRLMRRLGPQAANTLDVRERLVLDAKNSLVVVAHQDGRRWLLGCGEHGVTVVEREPAGEGGAQAGSRRGEHGTFSSHLASTDGPSSPTGHPS